MSSTSSGHDGDELSAVDRRRAAYRQLIDGELATGDGERVLFFVHSVDLRHASPDLIAAAGLGLALADRGYGVRLVPRHRWHLGGAADIWIATTPDADPSQAPAGAWRMAWAHSDVEAWAELDHLMAYDQILVGSEVGRSILATTSAGRLDVLRNAADTELFAPHDDDGPRDGVASLGVYVERGRAIAAADQRRAIQRAAHRLRRASAQHALEPARPARGADRVAARPGGDDALRADRDRAAHHRCRRRDPAGALLREHRLRLAADRQRAARCHRVRTRGAVVHDVGGARRADHVAARRPRADPLPRRGPARAGRARAHLGPAGPRPSRSCVATARREQTVAAAAAGAALLPGLQPRQPLPGHAVRRPRRRGRLPEGRGRRDRAPGEPRRSPRCPAS